MREGVRGGVGGKEMNSGGRDVEAQQEARRHMEKQL